MKVMKFGGTSVGTVESINSVRDIVAKEQGELVVVVSALGGITNLLIKTANDAADGAYENGMSEIRQRHDEVLSGVLPSGAGDVRTMVDELLGGLASEYEKIKAAGKVEVEALDRVVSFGERMSSLIVAEVVGAKHVDSLELIKTHGNWDKNVPDMPLTNKLIEENIDTKKNRVILCGGFISTDADSGRITNLGRGGSDYTAAIIA
ncbi:MAG: bifunctional aspartate kinase/homoserine dehydrogenase I, partial [Paludibacteraceae bacterium]|nr:bifunctional aspartate kinase/homoserine dehydrogenase I [Paludibacteraceae bacterium]